MKKVFIIIISIILEIIQLLFTTPPIDECTHSGGIAYCSQQAICEVCGEKYGEYDLNNHIGDTEVKNIIAVKQSCGVDYFGDIYCLTCNQTIEKEVYINSNVVHDWVIKYLYNPYQIKKTCIRCQLEEIIDLQPLDISYIGMVDNRLYFEPINNYKAGYTKLTYSYTYTTPSGFTGGSYNNQGAESIPYAENVIITITLFEYTNNLAQKSPYRKITKYFDTSTFSWVEVKT